MPDRVRGLLLVSWGVLFLSPDSLLVRLGEQPPEVTLFWRGLLQGLGLLLITGWRFGVGWWEQVKQTGSAGVVCVFGFVGSSVFFVLAVQNAIVGHVLVLLNTAPMMAGLLSWWILKEIPSRLTWGLIAVSIVGATLIVLDHGGDVSVGTSSTFGLLMALCTALASAINFLGARAKAPLDVTPVLVFGCFGLSLGAALLGGAVIPPWESFRWLVLLGGFFLPLAYAGIQLGPRYLSAPETSLILLLETVIGSLLVWFFLNEVPGPRGVLGGSLIVGSLMAKGWWEWRQQAQRKRV
jgi:drug/metabolite transporter (DMT)-like permease